MHVQTGSGGRKGALAGLLVRDLAFRQLGNGREVVLGCGSLDHTRGRMGRDTYVFEDAASAVLLLRGGGWYRDGAYERRLAPGDLFLRLPGREHRTTPDADGQWVEFFLHLPRRAWEAAVEAGLTHGVGLVWHPGLHDDLLLRLADLRERMRDQTTWSTCSIIGTMVGLLAELRGRHDAADGASADPLARAELLLRAQLDQVLPVGAVATRVGLPWETFRKRFRARTGQSPAQYRQQARMQHAATLLANHDLGVAEIAALVGYADGFAFSKAYRRWSGAPPSAGRQPRPGAA